MSLLGISVQFLVSLVVSTLIIYVVTKMLGEKEGFGTAIMTALFGAIIYTIAFYFLGAGVWASIIGGVAWLITLANMYKIGWLKSILIAIIIWIISFIVSLIWPSLNII